VNNHKNGKDPLPDLIAMLNESNGRDKVIIMAQICSYTILFANNLRAGVEQFMVLLEEPKINNDHLIIVSLSHFKYQNVFYIQNFC
jgi:hypothetical protein